jgi:hypothetical protein
MKYYEIRVLNQRSRASLIYHQLHRDDTVAIRSAENIADGQPFGLARNGLHSLGCRRYADKAVVDRRSRITLKHRRIR